jgi:hypothetical protein
MKKLCSVVGCDSLAEVFCECKKPAILLCQSHGFEHFRVFEHEIQELSQ